MGKRIVKPGDKLGIFTIVRELEVHERKNKWNREVEVTCEMGGVHRRSLFHLSNRQNFKCYPCTFKSAYEQRDLIFQYVIGHRYGCWTAIKAVPRFYPNDYGRLVLCRCDCGEEREMTTTNLISEKFRPRCRLVPKPKNYEIKDPADYIKSNKYTAEKRAILYVEEHKDE